MKKPFLSLSDSEWNLIENLMNWKPPIERGTPSGVAPIKQDH